MNANYDLLVEAKNLDKKNELAIPKSYFSVRQDIWSEITIFWILLAPIASYIAEKVWQLRGLTVVGWGIAIIALFSSLLRYSKLKISRYFLLSSIYYLATILIPTLFGTNFKIIFNTDLLLCLGLLISANASISTKIYKQALKWIVALIIVSVVVIIIQQFYNPLFMVSDTVSENFTWEKFSNFQYRLPSIWSYINPNETSGCFYIMALYAILLGYMIERKINGWLIGLLCASILIYVVLTKTRYIIIVYLIISSMIYRLLNRTVNQIAVLTVLFLCIILLLYSGFPLLDLVQYRYLDKQVGGIVYGSFGARTSSWDAFTKYIGSAWLLGIDMSKQASDYYNYLGRSTGQNLLGIVYPLITYGIIGSIWYYLLLFFLLRDSYKIGRESKNYGFFVLFVSFIVTGFANGTPLGNLNIIMAIMFMKYYQDNIIGNKRNLLVQTY
ncbi:MAG TPA: hypothetical protein PKJ14_01730 [Candidatus Cloacimonadota bacterium]|nr:hypothetical protein [Candidatus Cloacimonadota bacterium]HQL14421.1 hypothetical protein [Candidatus Cloacimonadota bacterium]